MARIGKTGEGEGQRSIVTIGATIGIIATVVGYAETAFGVIGKLYRWTKRLWYKEPETRYIYLWTVGDEDHPAGPAEIGDLSKAIATLGPDNSSFVTHHAVGVQRIALHNAPGWIWKIGSVDRPAGPADIQDMLELLQAAAEDKTVNAIVCHHNVSVEPLGSDQFKAVWVKYEPDQPDQLKALSRDHEQTS